MHEVNVGRKSLADYRSIVPKDLMAEIDELGEQLKGRQVLHVNATAFGGGVAEILYTLVPLVNDIGLEAHWQVLTAPPEFYNVTKSFHNGLQGHAVDFPAESRALYEEVCRANAAELTRPYDFVVIHDPQPLAVRDFVSLSQDRSTWWIWRCHIDTSTPDQGLYDYLLPSINRYDAAVYTLRDYVPQGLTVPVREIAPTIDPLAPKNMQLSPEDAQVHRAPVRHRRGPAAPAPGLALRPVEGPAGRRRRLPHRQGEAPRRAAGAGGLHGQRRPGGLGVPGQGHRLRGRRPRRLHPLQPRQRRVGGDQRVPEPRRRDHAEVHARGVRPHRDRGAVEGAGRSSAATSAASRCRSRTGSPATWSARPRSARSGACEIMADPARHHEMALLGKEKVRREFLTPRLLRDDLRLFADLLEGKIGA